MFLIPKSPTGKAHKLNPKGKPFCGAHITGGTRSKEAEGYKVCGNCGQAERGERRVMLTARGRGNVKVRG